jgi:hypothetical protein
MLETPAMAENQLGRFRLFDRKNDDHGVAPCHRIFNSIAWASVRT